ncbi:G-patch domain [Macleaya cordata]|uniref:G-patch domain n=1 Tax=Macleaya cordata TaxID=56857 RepID=A0A200Q889_MACCD|nr:G-patch domain [Macleaya cordata]
MADQGTAEEEDDYMGDLSMFLPPETSQPPKAPPKKNSSNSKTLNHEPSNKKPKTLNWQERRKIDRERKQREEDEKTLTNMESAIPQSNIGFKMLKQMGYNPGSALGKGGSGLAEPVGVEIRRSRAGIGRDDPVKEKLRRDEFRAEKKKEEVEGLMVEFGCRQKLQWKSRRVVYNYDKAKAVLDQLENKEIIEPMKNEEDEDGDEKEEDEEEEEITEEDLRELLIKLRDEHRYCLFCGCQYESVEALLSSCPGIDEDDH